MSGPLPLYAHIEGRSKYRRVWRAGSKKSGIHAEVGHSDGARITISVIHNADGKFKAVVTRHSPQKPSQVLYQGILE